jgi:hypothetical protein
MRRTPIRCTPVRDARLGCTPGMHAYKMYACKRCTPMRCTSMSHPANVYPESGLIFGGNPAKDKPHGPPLCWVACGGVLWCPRMVPLDRGLFQNPCPLEGAQIWANFSWRNPENSSLLLYPIYPRTGKTQCRNLLPVLGSILANFAQHKR